MAQDMSFIAGLEVMLVWPQVILQVYGGPHISEVGGAITSLRGDLLDSCREFLGWSRSVSCQCLPTELGWFYRRF